MDTIPKIEDVFPHAKNEKTMTLEEAWKRVKSALENHKYDNGSWGGNDSCSVKLNLDQKDLQVVIEGLTKKGYFVHVAFGILFISYKESQLGGNSSGFDFLENK